MRFSAAVAVALLHTLTVGTGYFNYQCLLISLKYSGHSFMTSGINAALSPRELALVGARFELQQVVFATS